MHTYLLPKSSALVGAPAGSVLQPRRPRLLKPGPGPGLPSRPHPYARTRVQINSQLSWPWVRAIIVEVTMLSCPRPPNARELALEIVKRWEGCELVAYPDPATGGDPWTIGYGATGPGIGPGVQWTLEQAEARLERDLDRFMGGVKERLEWYAGPEQLAAMTSLAYNIGLGAFGRSTLLRKFNAGDVRGAAAEFDRWVFAGGKRMRGLERRRADERALFEGAGDGHPDREDF